MRDMLFEHLYGSSGDYIMANDKKPKPGPKPVKPKPLSGGTSKPR